MKQHSILAAYALVSMCFASLHGVTVQTTFTNQTNKPITVVHGTHEAAVAPGGSRVLLIDSERNILAYTVIDVSGNEQPFEARMNLFGIDATQRGVMVTFPNNTLENIALRGGRLRGSSHTTRTFVNKPARERFITHEVYDFKRLRK